MKIKNINNLNLAKGTLFFPLQEKEPLNSTTFKDINNFLNLKIENILKQKDFKWKENASVKLDLFNQKQLTNLAIVCIADSKDFGTQIENYRTFAAAIATLAKSYTSKTISLYSEKLNLGELEFCKGFLEGALLANYTFLKYKSKKIKEFNIAELLLINAKKNKISAIYKEVSEVCSGTILARDLVNTPPLDCTPSKLVAQARQIAKKSKLQIQIFDRKKLQKMKAGGILAVSKGSDEPPFLIKLTYRPRRKAKKVIAIVGKGVTFDSGGLSMKPADGMMNMKIDMAGAAAVLGTMQAIGTIKPDVEVRAYIPTTENMINGSATRPGDVIRAMNGKTIEVLNTDAEGRLILADALSLAVKEKADEIVDLATLTGAVVVALGSDIAAIYCNNEKLEAKLKTAANLAGEKIWSMPLAKEYEHAIISSIADIKNIGKGRTGGSITAALFLKHFVGDTPWAHFDIAGTAESDSAHDYIPKGGVGFGVRTLVQYLTAK
jgi:leucyl aminopeptidase